MTYIECNKERQFQIIFELKKHYVNPELNHYNAISSELNADYIKIESAFINLKELIVPFTRDEVFKLRKYELLFQGVAVLFHDYWGIDPRINYYL